MIKKPNLFIWIILYFLSTSGIANAEPIKIKTPEDFASEFLVNKMTVLVTKNIDDIDKYFSKHSQDSQKYLMFNKQNLLEDYLISYASNDYVIERVIPEVKIITSKVDGNKAEIDAVLKAEIFWNASNALGEAIRGIKTEKHLFILNKEDEEWKIIADKFMTCRGHSDESINEDYRHMTETIEKLKKEALDSFYKAKRSKPTRLTLALPQSQSANSVNKRSSSNITNQPDPRQKSEYNRQAAFDWAHTYWKNYSTAYINLGDQEGEGGDCTNFVSQCLRAGGAQNDKKGSYLWYYDGKGSYSWTWSTARGLNSILLGNYKLKEFGPKAVERIIEQDSDYDSSLGEYLTLGDLIQYEWSVTSKIKHSAIIVNMIYNSSKERFEPVISTHSSDSWYLPWTKNAYRTHFVHVTGIN